MATPTFVTSAEFHDDVPGATATKAWTLLSGTNRIVLFIILYTEFTPANVVNDRLVNNWTGGDPGIIGKFDNHTNTAFFRYNGIDCHHLTGGYLDNASDGFAFEILYMDESMLPADGTHDITLNHNSSPNLRTIYVYEAENCYQALPLYSYHPGLGQLVTDSLDVKMQAMANDCLYAAVTGVMGSGSDAANLTDEQAGSVVRESQQVSSNTDYSLMLSESLLTAGIKTLNYTSDGGTDFWFHMGIHLYPDDITESSLRRITLLGDVAWEKDISFTPNPWTLIHNLLAGNDRCVVAQIYVDDTVVQNFLTPTYDGAAPSASSIKRGSLVSDVYIQQFIWLEDDLPGSTGNHTLSVDLPNGPTSNGVLACYCLQNVDQDVGIESEYGGQDTGSSLVGNIVSNTTQYQNRLFLHVLGIGDNVGAMTVHAYARTIFADAEADTNEAYYNWMLTRNCDPADNETSWNHTTFNNENFSTSVIALVPVQNTVFIGATSIALNAIGDLSILKFSGTTSVVTNATLAGLKRTRSIAGVTSISLGSTLTLRKLRNAAGASSIIMNAAGAAGIGEFNLFLGLVDGEAVENGGITQVVLAIDSDTIPTGTYPAGEGIDGAIIGLPQVSKVTDEALFGVVGLTTVRLRIANADGKLNSRDLIGTNARLWFAKGAAVTEVVGTVSAFKRGAISDLTIQELELSRLQDDLPKVEINTTDFPTATDVGVLIPIIFGRAVQVRCLYVRTDNVLNTFDFIIAHNAGLAGNLFNDVFSVYRNNIRLDEITGTSGTDFLFGGKRVVTLDAGDRRPSGWYNNWWITEVSDSTVHIVESYDGDANEVTLTTSDSWTNNSNYILREWRFYQGGGGDPVPGFASLRFLKRLGKDGSFDNIYADVNGLQTEVNFVRAIESLLINTTWGLGLSIDQTSFDNAAALASVTVLKSEGAIVTRTRALDIIKELLSFQDCRLTKIDGAIAIDVDQVKTVDATFGANDTGGLNNILDAQGVQEDFGDTDTNIKTIIIEYRKNYKESNTFIQKQTRAANMHGIEKTIQFNLLYDNGSADRIAYYKSQRAISFANKLPFTAGFDAETIDKYNLLTIELPHLNINKDYEVIGIRKTLGKAAAINTMLYRPTTYVYISGVLNADESFDIPPNFDDTPADPVSNVVISSDIQINPNTGKETVYFTITYDPPEENFVEAAVKYKLSIDTRFTDGTKDSGTLRFPVSVAGADYDFGIFAIGVNPNPEFWSYPITESATSAFTGVNPNNVTSASATSTIKTNNDTGQPWAELKVTWTDPTQNFDKALVEYKLSTDSNSEYERIGIEQSGQTFRTLLTGVSINIRIISLNSNPNFKSSGVVISHTLVSDNVAPPTPNTPTSRVQNFVFEFEAPFYTKPPDFKRFEAEISTSSGSLIETISPSDEIIQHVVTTSGLTRKARFRAVDFSENKSSYSNYSLTRTSAEIDEDDRIDVFVTGTVVGNNNVTIPAGFTSIDAGFGSIAFISHGKIPIANYDSSVVITSGSNFSYNVATQWVTISATTLQVSTRITFVRVSGASSIPISFTRTSFFQYW